MPVRLCLGQWNHATYNLMSSAEIADDIRLGVVRRCDGGDVPGLLPGGLSDAALGLGQGQGQEVPSAMLVLMGRPGGLADMSSAG